MYRKSWDALESAIENDMQDVNFAKHRAPYGAHAVLYTAFCINLLLLFYLNIRQLSQLNSMESQKYHIAY
jgi:hypothetical protein